MIGKNLTIKQRYNLIKKPEPAAFELKGKNQQYPRKLFDKSEREVSPAQIIKYAIKNERAARNMESNNTLTFIVDVKATKPQIKDAVVKMYGFPVQKVNTLITFKHYAKKAFVRFKDEGAAIDVASRAGVL
ncbi:large subunit ribosomal protein L23Ae [Pancytospora epiphaga]|nr:large subunit ribosomal protein L23Ae [Pancytospora epiphaga]